MKLLQGPFRTVFAVACLDRAGPEAMMCDAQLLD
jgi:hypothetical protein